MPWRKPGKFYASESLIFRDEDRDDDWIPYIELLCHHQMTSVENSLAKTTTMAQSRTFVADAERIPGYINVLLIATGSVASVKVPLIVEELLTVRDFIASFRLELVFTMDMGFGKAVSQCEGRGCGDRACAYVLRQESCGADGWEGLDQR